MECIQSLPLQLYMTMEGASHLQILVAVESKLILYNFLAWSEDELTYLLHCYVQLKWKERVLGKERRGKGEQKQRKEKWELESKSDFL